MCTPQRRSLSFSFKKSLEDQHKKRRLRVRAAKTTVHNHKVNNQLNGFASCAPSRIPIVVLKKCGSRVRHIVTCGHTKSALQDYQCTTIGCDPGDNSDPRPTDRFGSVLVVDSFFSPVFMWSSWHKLYLLRCRRVDCFFQC